MTIFAIACLLVSLGLVGGVAHPRTRRLLIAKEPQKQLPGETQALREWKQVFRDTVISVEGALSPEMEAFLTDEEVFVSKLLADAKIQAEKMRAEIIAKAEAERAEILKEQEEWAVNGRPLLVGSAYKEYDDDYKAAKSPTERGSVIERWHRKGFAIRAHIERSCLAMLTTR